MKITVSYGYHFNCQNPMTSIQYPFSELDQDDDLSKHRYRYSVVDVESKKKKERITITLLFQPVSKHRKDHDCKKLKHYFNSSLYETEQRQDIHHDVLINFGYLLTYGHLVLHDVPHVRTFMTHPPPITLRKGTSFR